MARMAQQVIRAAAIDREGDLLHLGMDDEQARNEAKQFAVTLQDQRDYDNEDRLGFLQHFESRRYAE